MADRNAAPEPLERLRAFVNTLDVESGRDALEDVAAVVEWFIDQGLLDRAPDVVDGDDLALVRETREAVRGLLRANLGDPVDPAAVEVLNRAASGSGLAVRFDADGASVTTTVDGIRGALGELLAIVSSAMREGSWSRLKACARDTCRWAFYDHSRNRSGRWCSMEVCGNRTKVENYRERHDVGGG